MQIKQISVTPNTSYLTNIVGKQIGHMIVINSISAWKQWYTGVITVGHIDAVPIAFPSRDAILIDGQNGDVYAVCGINIINGDIRITIPDGWSGKYAHLSIDISFLVN